MTMITFVFAKLGQSSYSYLIYEYVVLSRAPHNLSPSGHYYGSYQTNLSVYYSNSGSMNWAGQLACPSATSASISKCRATVGRRPLLFLLLLLLLSLLLSSRPPLLCRQQASITSVMCTAAAQNQSRGAATPAYWRMCPSLSICPSVCLIRLCVCENLFACAWWFNVSAVRRPTKVLPSPLSLPSLALYPSLHLVVSGSSSLF